MATIEISSGDSIARPDEDAPLFAHCAAFVHVGKRFNDFYKKEENIGVFLFVGVQKGNDGQLDMSKQFTLSSKNMNLVLGQKANFQKMLTAMTANNLPSVLKGGSFDPSSLIGKSFKIKVENKHAEGGKVYTNILTIAPCDQFTDEVLKASRVPWLFGDGVSVESVTGNIKDVHQSDEEDPAAGI